MPRIYETTLNGRTVRTWRRNVESAELALWVDRQVIGRHELLHVLARSLAELEALPQVTAYMKLDRVLPFQIDEMVYRVLPAKEGTRKFVGAIAGKLEDFPPRSEAKRALKPPPALEAMVDAAVAKRLAEIEKFINLYALREEAWRYMESVSKRIERLEEEIKLAKR